MGKRNLRQAKARLGGKAGKYTLRALIDVGGMAAVYRATRWRREVAVKVLHRVYCTLPEAVERFGRESLAANRVNHPAVVEVLEHGQLDDGTPWFAMELLHGMSLEQRLASTPRIPEDEAVAIGVQVADVLAAAHAAGVIHRDIKPGNVFITTDGNVKVLDFGLARVLEPGSLSSTKNGTIIGTASYMSPEQALADPDEIDERTDLWSLGALMFRMLTGRTVHDTKGQTQTLVAAASQKAPEIASVAEVSPALANVIDRALSFGKMRRHQTATELRDDLEAIAAGASPALDWDDAPVVSVVEDASAISVVVESAPASSSILITFAEESGLGSSFELSPRDDDDGFDVTER